MRRLILITLATLLTASTASAGPIVSAWTPTPAPDPELYKSEDCDEIRHLGLTCHIYGLVPAGTEVAVGGFGYTGWPGGAVFFSITEYVGAPGFSWDGLSFTHDNGRGFASNSWGGTHQKLIRQTLACGEQYWLGAEDLPSPLVFDYDDLILTWTVANDDCAPPPCLTDCGPLPPPPPPPPPPCPDCVPVPACTVDCEQMPPTVPEPALFALVGLGLLAVRRRRHA